MVSSRQTFAEYMDQALYGPQGYYSSGAAKSGRGGDYFTAPDTGPAFGQLLALTFQDWQRTLKLDNFQIAEAGPGEGALAEALRSHLHFPYTAIERSPARQGILREKGFKVQSELATVPPFSGVLFANELLDAFPVHRVRVKHGKLEEGYVEDGQLVWQDPSTAKLHAYLDRLKIQLPEGYETEINLAMADWFVLASQALKRGLVLLIDYGRPAQEYYAPERTRGTLRGFSKHRIVDVSGPHPQREGDIDLTSDVDFTSAALDARAAGFTPLAFMELGAFLLEAAAQLPAGQTPPKGLKYLLHPDAMGSAFHVLVLGKQASLAPQDFPHNRLARLGL
jgi:SAM-dependent MidA family methyltransferase